MTWDDGNPYVDQLADGVYAYVQPDGGWMVNNCGVAVDGSGTAILVDTTSTEKRNRAVLAEVAKVSTGAPRAVRNERSRMPVIGPRDARIPCPGAVRAADWSHDLG